MIQQITKKYKYLIESWNLLDMLQRIMFCYSRLTCLKDYWSILECAWILGMERIWITLYRYLYKYCHFLLSHSLPSISDQRGKKSCEVTDKTRWVNIFKNEFCIKVYTYIYIYVTVIDCIGKSLHLGSERMFLVVKFSSRRHSVWMLFYYWWQGRVLSLNRC